MKKKLLFIVSAVVLLSCSATQKARGPIFTAEEQALADTLLRYALDHEAVYTLADTLKPISSVKFLNYKIAKDSTQHEGDALVVKNLQPLVKIETYQRLCNKLSTGDWLFVITPFENVYKGVRNMEISVIRKSVFAKMLAHNTGFFGQWGFVANADPATVLTAIEYEKPGDRYRGYGYMFGYPAYAVDFFVQSALQQAADSMHKLVARDFISIPVYAGEKGYFTYAVPKGYARQNVDDKLYHAANATLDIYRKLRAQYETPHGVKATALWKAMLK